MFFFTKYNCLDTKIDIIVILLFAALPHQWNYIVDVVVNASDEETFGLFRDSLNAISFPLQLDNNTDITDISITTGIKSISQ